MTEQEFDEIFNAQFSDLVFYARRYVDKNSAKNIVMAVFTLLLKGDINKDELLQLVHERSGQPGMVTEDMKRQVKGELDMVKKVLKELSKK